MFKRMLKRWVQHAYRCAWCGRISSLRCRFRVARHGVGCGKKLHTMVREIFFVRCDHKRVQTQSALSK